MQTILVTGGAGFIGGNFVRHLMRDCTLRVINLDALTHAGHLETIRPLWNHPRHTFVHGNIQNRQLIAQLFDTYRPDTIVHLAAESRADPSIDDPDAMDQTNVVGTNALLDAARHYYATLLGRRRESFRFIQVSTDEVFGTLGAEGSFTEESIYRPASPFSVSKAAADLLAFSYFHTYGLPVIITHCCNNYGPFQFPDQLIPRMLFSALAGRPLLIDGDGGHVRDWLHVSDHCRALSIILHRGRPGERYVIGGNSERTHLEVVRLLCELLEEHVPGIPYFRRVEFVPDRPGCDRRYATDATKIRTTLGWQAQYDFTAGLRNTLTWYLARRDWCNAVTRGLDGGERLGISPPAFALQPTPV